MDIGESLGWIARAVAPRSAGDADARRGKAARRWVRELERYAVLLVLTLALIIPLTAGDFDLSVAAVLTFSAMLLAILNARLGWPLGAAFLAGLGMGLVVGLVNAFFILFFRTHSLIVTLGTASFIQGLILGVSASQLVRGRRSSRRNDGPGPFRPPAFSSLGTVRGQGRNAWPVYPEPRPGPRGPAVEVPADAAEGSGVPERDARLGRVRGSCSSAIRCGSSKTCGRRKLSPEHALAEYGVVIEPTHGRLNREETAARRATERRKG